MEKPRNPAGDSVVGTPNLYPLGQLSDFEVADDSIDVRGWKVKTSDDRTLGRVDDLLVDTQLMTTRHLLVDLEKEMARDETKRIVVPVSRASIDEVDRVVRLAVSSTDVMALAPNAGTIAPDYDRTIGTSEPAPRRTEATAGTAEDVKRLTRSAGEMGIKRR